MTYEKLLELLTPTLTKSPWEKLKNPPSVMDALREVVQLHKPDCVEYPELTYCSGCQEYGFLNQPPCPTIEAIKKQLK